MAYSSTFAFSIPGGTLGIDQFAPDSTLSISDDPDGERWLARRVVLNASIDNGGVIRSEWHPWEDVSIRTWLVPPSTPDSTFHTRIHKITNHSTKHLTAADASFANETEAVRNANSIKKSGTQHYASETAAFTVSNPGVSGVIDLLGDGPAEVRSADVNTNIVFTRTVIPMILTQVKPGEDKWNATRIDGKPSGSSTKPVNDTWLTEWEGQEHSAGTKFSDVAALKAEFPCLA
ncbi:hypothetical protein CALVIDRAFT_46444 [Calocera viscosa TUFC12733]|uniref:DUF2264 domain-containing protein n=1 Tax=Calocera viscosa (strain TUFC12733) TaxID=1330018 RepID=A0A167FLJ2_CALVF|nr:hypothetical protein CALVIDRAFT_46444 [Calocera viscosa TUFC12733]